MDRYIRRDLSSLKLLNNDDDEEKLYEKQLLIDDQELCCDDETNFFSAHSSAMRHRQSTRPISAGDNSYDNNYELKAINNNLKTRDLNSEPTFEFTYYVIQPGDSLQSICLRYACSVNHVKRLNGLISDQDFYGLRKIKLPLGKLGLLQELLKTERLSDGSNELVSQSQTADNSPVRPRFINSPGTAHCVSRKPHPKFKPLMSPGYSSDEIDHSDLHPSSSVQNNAPLTNGKIPYHKGIRHNHSNSFTSLREFDDISIDIDLANRHQTNQNNLNEATSSRPQKFIKSELDVQANEAKTVDDILELEYDNKPINNVFQDLDYHLEQAKAAAENYDQKAAELTNRIGTVRSDELDFHRARVSKIPELFSCSENFGLSYKNLIIFIVIVCLVAPLLYIKQR